MSQIPQRHFSKDWLSQQRKTQTSLHVRATRSRASGAKHRHKRTCNQAFSSGKTGPQWRVARMGHRGGQKRSLDSCFLRMRSLRTFFVGGGGDIFFKQPAYMLLQNSQFCWVKAESELNISMICGAGADAEQNLSERTRSQKNKTPSIFDGPWPQNCRGGRSHFFGLRLRSYSKIIESGSGTYSNL